MIVRSLLSLVTLLGALTCLWQMTKAWEKNVVPPSPGTVPWPPEYSEVLVVIDPGHGGQDGGTGGFGGLEKVLSLEISKKVRNHLTEKGLRVLMTREDDTYVSLEDRNTKSTQAGATVFVSIHLNADATSADTAGIEIFYSSRRPLGDIVATRQALGIQPGMTFTDERSQLLASMLMKRTAKNTGAANRYVRDSNYYVVVHSKCPAVLVECGYLTNLNESTSLQNTIYQDKMAQALGDGIHHFVMASLLNPKRGIVFQ